MMLQTLLLLASASLVLGHGRVTQPPSRASAWRLGFPTPANYDDDGLNCGGFSTQWSSNGGKCGICGDAYSIPPPRPHELGGTYGLGVIVAKYLPGATIATTTHLTASHMGYWEFKLCPDPTDNSQACFDRHLLVTEDGDTKYAPTRGSGIYEVNYRLPTGLVCEHCVLQWRYVAGNNWGICSNGTSGLGCGNQEEFRACSDIAIGVSKTLNNDLGNIPSPLLIYLQKGYFELDQAGYLTHQDPKRPMAPQRPSRPRPSNRQPKPAKHRPQPQHQPSHRQPTSNQEPTTSNRPAQSSNQQPTTSNRQSQTLNQQSQLLNRQPQTFNQYFQQQQNLNLHFQSNQQIQSLNRPLQSSNSQTHASNYQTANRQPPSKEQLQQFHLHAQTSNQIPPSNRQQSSKQPLQQSQLRTQSSNHQPPQSNWQPVSNQLQQSRQPQPSYQQNPSHPHSQTPIQKPSQTLKQRPHSKKPQSSKRQHSSKRKPKSKRQQRYEHKTSDKRKNKSKKKKKAHGHGKQKTRSQRYSYLQNN